MCGGGGASTGEVQGIINKSDQANAIAAAEMLGVTMQNPDNLLSAYKAQYGDALGQSMFDQYFGSNSPGIGLSGQINTGFEGVNSNLNNLQNIYVGGYDNLTNQLSQMGNAYGGQLDLINQNMSSGLSGLNKSMNSGLQGVGNLVSSGLANQADYMQQGFAGVGDQLNAVGGAVNNVGNTMAEGFGTLSNTVGNRFDDLTSNMTGQFEQAEAARQAALQQQTTLAQNNQQATQDAISAAQKALLQGQQGIQGGVNEVSSNLNTYYGGLSEGQADMTNRLDTISQGFADYTDQYAKDQTAAVSDRSQLMSDLEQGVNRLRTDFAAGNDAQTQIALRNQQMAQAQQSKELFTQRLNSAREVFPQVATALPENVRAQYADMLSSFDAAGNVIQQQRMQDGSIINRLLENSTLRLERMSANGQVLGRSSLDVEQMLQLADTVRQRLSN